MEEQDQDHLKECKCVAKYLTIRKSWNLGQLTALLARIDDVKDSGSQMSEGSDSLHLDRVPFLEGVIENSGSVDDLPAQVLVVGVADVQRLRREGVRLNLDVSPGDLVDEAGLANVRKATDEQSPGVGIDGGQTAQVLAHLLQVGQTLGLPLHDGGHSAESSALQLLAAVQRVSIFHQADVVLRHVVDLEGV